MSLSLEQMNDISAQVGEKMYDFFDDVNGLKGMLVKPLDITKTYADPTHDTLYIKRDDKRFSMIRLEPKSRINMFEGTDDTVRYIVGDVFPKLFEEFFQKIVLVHTEEFLSRFKTTMLYLLKPVLYMQHLLGGETEWVCVVDCIFVYDVTWSMDDYL